MFNNLLRSKKNFALTFIVVLVTAQNIPRSVFGGLQFMLVIQRVVKLLA